MRNSILIYDSFIEACRELDAEQFKTVFLAICDYGMKDEQPKLAGVEKALFIMAKPQIDANNKRYENGKKGAAYGKLGGRPKKKPEENAEETASEPQENPTETPNVNVNDNVNVNVNDNKVIKARQARFIPPTPEEVKAYADEKGLRRIDPEKFCDFYESKAWHVGKNKMKDWKAAARNWDRSQTQQTQARPAKQGFNNFTGRKYDNMDELTRRLIGSQ